MLWMNRVLGVGLILVAAGSARAVTLIDFESIPTGPQASGFLSSYGIASVIQSGGVTAFEVRDMSDPDAIVPSGVNMFLPGGFYYPNAGVATTTLTFSTPVNYFQFKKYAEAQAPYTYGIAGWKAEAYDAANVLVDSDGINFSGGLDFPSTSTQTYNLSGANPIQSVVISVNYNYQSTSGTVPIDDFQFDPVPEPGSVLGMVGLAIIGAMRRRKR
jgi:hypothetical protein